MSLITRLLLIGCMVWAAPFLSAAQEAIEILPADSRRIIDGKVGLHMDPFAGRELRFRRGADVDLVGNLTNGTSDDLIILWRDPDLIARGWELRRGYTAYVPPHLPGFAFSGPVPDATYRILFSARTKHTLSAKATLRVTGKANVPDFVGKGTVELQLNLRGFIGTTQRPATFHFKSNVPVEVTE